MPIDVLYRVPLAFDDQDGDGVTLPNLKDVGWVRTPSLQMPGTRIAGPSNNFFLVHALLNDGLTAQEIEDTIAGACLGAVSWPPIPEVLDLDNPIITPVPPVIDPETEEVLEPGYDDITYPVLTPAYREEIIAVDKVALIDFMNDIDDVGTRPADLSVMHIYAGRPWLFV